MAFQTSLMNRKQPAEWIPQIQAVSAFTLAQTLGTRQEQCHVSLVSFPVMAFKAVRTMSFVSSHPNILTDCQIDVKLKKLSCSVFSRDSKAVIVVRITVVRCEAKCHTHPEWPARSGAYRCGRGKPLQEHISKQIRRGVMNLRFSRLFFSIPTFPKSFLLLNTRR